MVPLAQHQTQRLFPSEQLVDLLVAGGGQHTQPGALALACQTVDLQTFMPHKGLVSL